MNPDPIFKISSPEEFNVLALQVFHHQYQNNPVYRKFCTHLAIDSKAIQSPKAIPFLPISFFKSHVVLGKQNSWETVFTSSGTTHKGHSNHYITDLSFYQQSYINAFNQFYGPVKDYCILALLPSYLEREGSSLIYMVSDLIAKSNHPKSGFYLHDIEGLALMLNTLDTAGTKIMLIGVSFALLDLIDQHQFQLNNTIVMETGGMKGRRKELIREELHSRLKAGFGVSQIHSEYGMTELLSQAYSVGNGLFKTPPWMQVFMRDTEDPLSYVEAGATGGINIIDLANYHSCSFIATQDLGKKYTTNFEVLGRFDHSDVRGCNLMIL